jgi:hypothetical protein
MPAKPAVRLHTPIIACFNCARTDLGVGLRPLIAAMQKYVDLYVSPVWATPARLVHSRGFVKGAWAIVFHENARDASLEGYHDLTPDGLPMAKVFVQTTLKQKEKVSVAASHELVEMLVDPCVNLYSSGPKQDRLYDYEAADPVEELSFDVDGIAMSNFVYPTYFEIFHKRGSTRFDHMGVLTEPFQVHKDGYQSYWSRGNEHTLWGSKAKRVRWLKEERDGHRSTFRGKTARPSERH